MFDSGKILCYIIGIDLTIQLISYLLVNFNIT